MLLHLFSFCYNRTGKQAACHRLARDIPGSIAEILLNQLVDTVDTNTINVDQSHNKMDN